MILLTKLTSRKPQFHMTWISTTPYLYRTKSDLLHFDMIQTLSFSRKLAWRWKMFCRYKIHRFQSPVRQQIVIWNSAGLLFFVPLGKFWRLWKIWFWMKYFFIRRNCFENIVKLRIFCLGLNIFIHHRLTERSFDYSRQNLQCSSSSYTRKTFKYLGHFSWRNDKVLKYLPLGFLNTFKYLISVGWYSIQNIRLISP